MIETLQCPTCGAPLDYDPRSDAETVRCPFCANTAVLPQSARAATAPQIVINTGFSRGVRRTARGAFAGVLVLLLVIFGFTGAIIFFVIRSVNRTVSVVTRSIPTRSTLMPTPPPGLKLHEFSGYTEPLMTFGAEGIGPGNFKDARSIAVDAQGRIYVGEYSGGRVQVFDSSGKFVTQWSVDPKMPLRALAAERSGTVYVVQSGNITRYEGTTGRSLGNVGAGSGRFDDVAVAADGGLVTFSYNSHDNIIRMDRSGQVSKVIQNAVSGQTDRSELDIRVAVDGLGNVYGLGTFNNAVFKFSPDGRFLTQFGSDGDEAGQFRAPGAIAVDNQGRVYVSDFKGVQIFDPAGRYLNTIKVKGAASGLAFNDRGELFVVARTQVYKFAPFKS
jgi:DNA-binding beta-propeller fold protein YncE